MDDMHALGLARRIVGNLGVRRGARIDLADPELPLHDPAELHGSFRATCASPTTCAR
jgi:3-methylcrotonyl-CoA carboxylase beta subunit